MKCNKCDKNSVHLLTGCDWVARCDVLGTSAVVGHCAEGDGESACNCSDQEAPEWDCDLGRINQYCIHPLKLNLSKQMIRAVELLKNEDFVQAVYPKWSCWINSKGIEISNKTMKALENRGLVHISLEMSKDSRIDIYVAKLIPSGCGERGE